MAWDEVFAMSCMFGMGASGELCGERMEGWKEWDLCNAERFEGDEGGLLLPSEEGDLKSASYHGMHIRLESGITTLMIFFRLTWGAPTTHIKSAEACT